MVVCATFRSANTSIFMQTVALLVVCLWPHVAAADPSAGEKIAVRCAPCHGANGISVHETWPNLAGQDEEYVMLQLEAFRDGTRQNAMMYPMAFDLSDQDIEDLASYYGNLGCD